jgi:peptidoglycan-associated lipoprotein
MIQSRTIVRGSLIALAVAGLAACASKPKPAPTPPPPPAATAPPPSGAPTAPVESQSTAPLPGSEQDFVINAGDRIYFDFDQYAIRPDAGPVLDAQAAWLNRYRAVRIRVEGNCDERGTRDYNFGLGSRRANAVRDYLVGRGIDPARIEVISYGKERPMDSGMGETAWSHNRNGHSQITSGAR